MHPYFDAAKQAEFLYECVNDTIDNVIPKEVEYLQKYDEMKRYLDDDFKMPTRTQLYSFVSWNRITANFLIATEKNLLPYKK